MIQILGIRIYHDHDGREKKKDAFFEKNWRSMSIKDLLENIEGHLEKIPEADRFNLFFTQANCTEKKREFKEQTVIPFDFDSIDTGRIPEYIKAFQDLIGLDPTVIFTGHGLHFMIHLKEPFTSTKFFEEKRVHYYAICDRMNRSFVERGLPGLMDRGFWKPNLAGFRLPGSENRKPGKPFEKARLIQLKYAPTEFNWSKISGIPDVKPDEQVNPRHYPAVDTKGILAGCDFLKHCKKSPDKVDEGQWYAMLSIVGRLKEGPQLCQEMSSGHKGYSVEETEIKINQALESSGPRTCKSINSLWKGCKDCPHYEKISSPISIKGKDFIETEGTGFHKVYVNAKGTLTTGKPSYDDLRKFFERGHSYRTMGESGICYVWAGTHYEILGDLHLETFAQEHFDPKAVTQMTKEFKSLVCRTHLTPPDWFTSTTEKKINFKNGTLDLRTGDLVPHSMENGFRYVLPYAYDEGAKCPNFDRFLRQVTSDDQDLANLLLEFAGYSFSGEFPWAQKILVLTGEGSNGKSTFMEVLRALAGKNNYSSLTWKAMNNQTTLQLMDGKLFNISEEAPKHALSDSTLFKNLTTGGEIQLKMLYKQPYEIQNKTKLIFACNELPQSEDTTKGFFRRFLIVPFKSEFSKEMGNLDPHIRGKLVLELPGIFNLVRKGYERLVTQTMFTAAAAAKRQLEEYQMDVDHATRWIKSNMHVLPLNGGCKWVVSAEVYQNYRNEMLNSGEKPLTAVGFGKKLSRIIPEYEGRTTFKKLQGKAHRVLLDVTCQSDAEM